MALHEIPEDSAPHAPTTAWVRGVQRVIRGTRVVFVHTNQQSESAQNADGGGQ